MICSSVLSLPSESCRVLAASTGLEGDPLVRVGGDSVELWSTPKEGGSLLTERCGGRDVVVGLAISVGGVVAPSDV